MSSHGTPFCIIPHIPLSGSLSFRATDDARPRVHVGFTPRWFAQHMELDYGPTWHNDPQVRLASMRRMTEILNERFPKLRLGGKPNAHLIVADIEAGTPDERVREIFRIAAGVLDKPVEHLLPRRTA